MIVRLKAGPRLRPQARLRKATSMRRFKVRKRVAARLHEVQTLLRTARPASRW